MIIGIGSDMVDIRRIEASLERFGDRFLQRVFTDTERARAERRPLQRSGSYAKRWAAKEACAKALGTGIRQGVYWRDMGVSNLASGQPTMHLTGGAAQRLQSITPPGLAARIHVSLTDDYPFALSFVMISAELTSMPPPSGHDDPGAFARNA